MRLPFAPLEALVAVESDEVLAEVLGVTRRTVWRYRAEGVSEIAADRLAVAAGFHPFEVWPELVDVATVVCDCGEVFVPVRGSHRFCSRRCHSRVTSREYRRRRSAA